MLVLAYGSMGPCGVSAQRVLQLGYLGVGSLAFWCEFNHVNLVNVEFKGVANQKWTRLQALY